MCGILGELPAQDAARFERSLHTLSHRGPDRAGLWTAPNEAVRLGHRRLAILDLSEQGDQPMHRDKLSLVFNGEVYNFLELRRELEQMGQTFVSGTDSEVILAAYQAWGADCLARFRGMFALAIWDAGAQELFLARDRFGQKPLFYHHDGPRFAFASEMKALLPHTPEDLQAYVHQPQANVSLNSAQLERVARLETLVKEFGNNPLLYYPLRMRIRQIRRNPQGSPRPKLPAEVMKDLRRYFAASNRALAEAYPDVGLERHAGAYFLD